MSDPNSDEELRRERAARLRRRVDEEVADGAEGSGGGSDPEPPAGESPRDFTHRRMRELGDEPE